MDNNWLNAPQTSGAMPPAAINAPYPATDCLECEPGAEPCPEHRLNYEDCLAILRCEVGHPPRFALVANSESAMEQAVGGTPERMCLPDGLCAILNENAVCGQSSFNCRLYGWDIWGDFLICRQCRRGYASVTAEDMQHVLGWVATTPPASWR